MAKDNTLLGHLDVLLEDPVNYLKGSFLVGSKLGFLASTLSEFYDPPLCMTGSWRAVRRRALVVLRPYLFVLRLRFSLVGFFFFDREMYHIIVLTRHAELVNLRLVQQYYRFKRVLTWLFMHCLGNQSSIRTFLSRYIHHFIIFN